MIAGMILQILCTNSGLPFFSCNSNKNENPHIINITVKKIMRILGSMNESTNEKNALIFSANTFVTMMAE